MDYGYQYPPTAYKHIPAYRNIGISVTPHFKIMDDGSWRLLHAAKHIPAKRHLGVALVMRSCFVGALLHGQFGVAIRLKGDVCQQNDHGPPICHRKECGQGGACASRSSGQGNACGRQGNTFSGIGAQSGKHSCQYRHNPKKC